MTRLASLPSQYRHLLPGKPRKVRIPKVLPDFEPTVPTARELEIAGIRRRLSLCAGRLTQNRERIEATIIAIEGELKRLKEVR